MENLGLIYLKEKKIEYFFPFSEKIESFEIEHDNIIIYYNENNKKLYRGFRSLNIIVGKNSSGKTTLINNLKANKFKVLKKHKNEIFLNDKLICRQHGSKIVISNEVISNTELSENKYIIENDLRFKNLMNSDIIKELLGKEEIFIDEYSIYGFSILALTPDINNGLIWDLLYSELEPEEKIGTEMNYQIEYIRFLENFILHGEIYELDPSFRETHLMKDVENIYAELGENEELSRKKLTRILEDEYYNILKKPRVFLDEFKRKYIFFNALNDDLIKLFNSVVERKIELVKFITILEEIEKFFSNPNVVKEMEDNYLLSIVSDVFLIDVMNNKLFTYGMNAGFFSFVRTLIGLNNGMRVENLEDETIVLLDEPDLYLDLEKQMSLINDINNMNFDSEINLIITTHSPFVVIDSLPFFTHMLKRNGNKVTIEPVRKKYLDDSVAETLYEIYNLDTIYSKFLVENVIEKRNENMKKYIKNKFLKESLD